MSKKKEYGDFQTPLGLATDVCNLLEKIGLRPASLLEPTCGLGSFIFAGMKQFRTLQQILGAEIHSDYVKVLESQLQGLKAATKTRVVVADFFITDWNQVVTELPEPVLVLGNLPWVTNAHLSKLCSQNLPTKSNFQNRSGLDAITGKSNFDISEWMLIRLLEALNGRHGALAMLCKSSVARKTLFHAWKHGIQIEKSAMYRIECDTHFDAHVDAVLLVIHFRPGSWDLEAKLYSNLNDAELETIIGIEEGIILSDVSTYRRFRHLQGECALKWRSGIKHDCSKVMELIRDGVQYRNGMNQTVELEDTYLFPMMKSSHVANGVVGNARWMLVPQRTIGESTSIIAQRAPRTWAYLNQYAEHLEKRASVIYRNRPPFSVFGVGDYSFAPWKVAISGFYKKLSFQVIGPIDAKPVVFDDTSYFLPFQTQPQAEYIASILNADHARAFYESLVFWDAKRPITADLLRRLDLRKLAAEEGSSVQFQSLFGSEQSTQTCSLFDAV